MRKTIISAVLAIDMTCYFDLLKKFNQRVECHWTVRRRVSSLEGCFLSHCRGFGRLRW